MRLKWIPALSIDGGNVDAQHQKLFDLYNAVASQPDDEVNLAELIAELAAYAATHFVDEEAHMRSIGYPEADYQAHVHLHAAFLQRVGQLSRGPVYQILDFIQEWLLRHIIMEDSKIGIFARTAAG